MEGHKRPNGWPVCPQRSSKSLSSTPEPDGVFIPKINHYVNPNFIGDPASPLPTARRGHYNDRTDTPYSWVSTELADDNSVPPTTKTERTLRMRPVGGPSSPAAGPDLEITGTSSRSSSSGSTSASSRLRRTFNSLLSNSMPAVSLFSAPREDVGSITQAARQNGLHTGVMRQPTKVKEEGQTSSASRIERRNSWWVLLGRDPVAVEHLLVLQEQQSMATIDKRPSTVMVAPPEVRIIGMTNFQMVFCTVLGALAMAFVLSVV